LIYVSDIHRLDADRIRLSIEASVQAYKAFDPHHPTHWQPERVTAPEGYELIDYWTGADAVFGHDKTVEVYGLVFRSQSSPGRYVFAFRGTDSLLDALDDLGVEHQRFHPWDTGVDVPGNVSVAASFQDIYRRNDGAVTSMQQQLFKLLDNYRQSSTPVEELLVTGHSLGAALGTLFMLDLAVSRPGVSARLINFASPRVGNHHFIGFYEQQVERPRASERSLRVQNVYDKVPCVPLEHMGYAHLPEAYLVAFYPHETLGKLDEVGCHSSLAYRAVVDCAAASEKGMCENPKLTVPGKTKRYHSEKPEEKHICTLW